MHSCVRKEDSLSKELSAQRTVFSSAETETETEILHRKGREGNVGKLLKSMQESCQICCSPERCLEASLQEDMNTEA